MLSLSQVHVLNDPQLSSFKVIILFVFNDLACSSSGLSPFCISVGFMVLFVFISETSDFLGSSILGPTPMMSSVSGELKQTMH